MNLHEVIKTVAPAKDKTLKIVRQVATATNTTFRPALPPLQKCFGGALFR